jgi:PAS domain-containing protein
MKNGRISYDELEKQNLILKQELNRFREQQNLLHLSELRFRMLYENSLDAILLTSPGGSIYSANAKACILFGLSEQELRSKGRASIIDKSDRRVNEAIEFRNKHGYFYGQMTFIRSDKYKI